MKAAVDDLKEKADHIRQGDLPPCLPFIVIVDASTMSRIVASSPSSPHIKFYHRGRPEGN